MTRDDVLKVVDEKDIQFIRVEYLDFSGVTRARTVRREALPDVLETGVNFSTAIMSFNSLDHYVPDPLYGPQDGDFWALPDPDTFAIVPYREKTARMFCDLVDVDGRPWEGCPRSALKRLLNQAQKDLGGTLNAAYEPEGMLFKSEGGHLVPADSSKCFSIEGVEVQAGFIKRVVDSLESMGIPVVQISSEYGPGQYEINLKYGPVLQATDAMVTFKHVFKTLGREEGYVATLMPKPFNELPGNGLHVHLSLFDSNGVNLFQDPGDRRGLEMSELAYCFTGGLLKHGEALTAIGAPTVNSYKRLLPGSWAPAHVCYGPANRSVLVRVPEKRRARRVEFRSGDGCCNPYLFSAALVAAGLDGVKNRIDPGEPVMEDVGHMEERRLRELGVRWIPRTLGEAIEALAKDEVIKNALGAPLFNEFIKVRRSEWITYAQYVDQWDRDAYLQTY